MSIKRVDSHDPSVLVFEPDPLMLTAIGGVLDMQGYRATLSRSSEMALNATQTQSFDAIIVSIDQLDAGCRLAEKMRSLESTTDTPLIFLVPELTNDWNVELAKHGGVSCMLKPGDPNTLIELVEKALWMPHVAGNRMQVPGNHFSGVVDWVKLNP